MYHAFVVNALWIFPSFLLATVAAAGAGWRTSFESNDGIFLVDSGNVSHCPDCIYESADHVLFDRPGVTLLLDQAPCNATPSSCCSGKQCAKYAAGHMRSAPSQAFGNFTFVARAPFPPSGAGGAPDNSFACITSSYLGTPHHEVASCFHAGKPSEVSLSYWAAPANANGVILQVDAGVDLHAAFHTYTIVWAPSLLTLLLDGTEIAKSTTAASTIPSRAGQVLLINRVMPADPFKGDSAMTVLSAAYAPL
jgi:beta-glucanase (GH16 family)